MGWFKKPTDEEKKGMDWLHHPKVDPSKFLPPYTIPDGIELQMYILTETIYFLFVIHLSDDPTDHWESSSYIKLESVIGE